MLGPRQREVVLLAAQGRANQDIADRLGIVVRTVENHLHRAYVELGVAGRGELAALLRPAAEGDGDGDARAQSVQRSPSTGGSPVIR